MGAKDTNFSLNAEEISLLSDSSFFIRKQLITERIVNLFGAIETEYDVICRDHQDILPQELMKRRGKISRGENYRSLPYILLDYPALFEKKGVFAFRTMMWWGHPFSFTFHLSGCYLERYLDSIFHALDKIDNETLICINSDQWEHHHETTNYIPLNEFLVSSHNKKAYFIERGFLKISKIVSLEDHQKMTQTGLGFLKEILEMLD